MFNVVVRAQRGGDMSRAIYLGLGICLKTYIVLMQCKQVSLFFFASMLIIIIITLSLNFLEVTISPYTKAKLITLEIIYYILSWAWKENPVVLVSPIIDQKTKTEQVTAKVID